MENTLLLPQFTIGFFYPAWSDKKNKWAPGIASHEVDLMDELLKTKDGAYYDLIAEVLAEPEEKKQKLLKLKLLPAYTISCTFKGNRDEDNLKHYNGLINIDIDGQGNDHIKNWPELRDQLFLNDPHIIAIWLSARGEGLSFIAKSTTQDRHLHTWFSIEDYYKKNFNLEIDVQCKDVPRLRFVSYDPQLKIREGVEFEDIPYYPMMEGVDQKVIDHKKNKSKSKKRIAPSHADTLKPTVHIPPTNGTEAYPENQLELNRVLITRAVKMIAESTDGHKRLACFNAGRLLGGHVAGSGVDMNEGLSALDYAIAAKDNVDDLDAAYENIRNGYDIGYQTPVEDAFYSRLVRLGRLNGIVPATGEVVAKPVSNEPPTFNTFWHTMVNNKEEVKINFSRLKFIKWIKEQGFYLLRINPEKVVIIRIVDNIVEYTDIIEIKLVILNYIQSLPWQFDLIFRDDLIEFILKGASNYFSTSTLDFLSQITLDIVRDTADTVHLFFKDTVVEITKDEIKTVPYKSIKGHIWKSFIIQHGFGIIQTPISDFDKLIVLVSGIPPVEKPKDPPFDDYEKTIKMNKELAELRYAAFKTVVGYMVSTHKNRAQPITPVLCDMIISENPSGGSGKGIVARAIAQVRNMMIIDGRDKKALDGSFSFQRVTPDTQIIFFDDVVREFEFERLFSIATEGMAINKKNKDESYVTFEKSPKPLVSTNYPMRGDSNNISMQRRKTDVEFCNYFDLKRTPKSEFGKQLYDEWNEEEWNNFFNIIALYTQSFLKNGLLNPKTVNVGFKRLISDTTQEFYDYFNDLYLKPNEYSIIYANELYDKYILDAKITSVKFPSRKMFKAIRLICEYHDLKYIQDRERDGARRQFFDLSQNKPGPNNENQPVDPQNVPPQHPPPINPQPEIPYRDEETYIESDNFSSDKSQEYDEKDEDFNDIEPPF